MAPRRAIRIDSDDLIAGAQLLSWIAFPHRPEHGVGLLNQWYWARRRFRGQAVPQLPWPLKKANRIEAQLQIFNARVLDAFRAGLWLQRRCWQSIPQVGPIAAGLRRMGASTRTMAHRRAETRGTAQAGEIRNIWSRRKPVLHLAWAAAEVLGSKYADEQRQGFDLERTLFQPDWISEALKAAESKAQMAARQGIFPLASFHRFHRDSF